MKHRTIAITVILLLAATSVAWAQDFFAERVYTRIYTPTADDRTAIADLGFSIDAVDLEEGFVEAWVPNELLDRIRKAGYEVAEQPVEVNAKDMPSGYEDYHDYPEMLAELQELNAAKPEITDLFSIGQTILGRELWCLKISDNPMKDEDDEAAFAVVAMHHAREVLSPEVALNVARQLVEGYGKNEEITHYVDTMEIYVVPDLNPDGSEYDHSNGTFHMWRKNRRTNQGSSCMGVDLNRNYGYKWGGVGSSGSPCADTYHGTVAFSEPETAAFRDLVLSRPNVTTVLSLHTHAKLVLYPWGYTYNHIADQVDFATHKTLAQYQAKTLGYTPTQSSGLYLTTGDTMDWAYGVLGATTFTYELTPSQFNPLGFYPSASVIDPTLASTWQSILYLVTFADDPSLALATNLWKQEATYEDGAVTLAWADRVETNAGGWRIMRAEIGGKGYEPINDQLLQPNQGTYTFVDDTVEADRTYQYLLHFEGTGANDVDFGPLTVTTGNAGPDDDDDTADDDDADDDTADDDAADDDDDDNDDGGCGC